MPIRFLEKLPIGCRYRHAKNNIYKKDMKRFKEKPKAIWHILKGGQYAVFVVNNGTLILTQLLIKLLVSYPTMPKSFS